MPTSSTYYESELADALDEPSEWLKRNLKAKSKRLETNDTFADSDVTFVAIAEHKGKFKGAFQIDTVNADDIYAWSDAPVFDLFDQFSEILNQITKTQSAISDHDEFEFECSELWRLVISLEKYLGISDEYNEVIAALLVIPVNGGNSYLDEFRLANLKSAFELINHKVILTEDTVDEFHDLLEAADFDLNYVFGFCAAS